MVNISHNELKNVLVVQVHMWRMQSHANRGGKCLLQRAQCCMYRKTVFHSYHSNNEYMNSSTVDI